MAAPSVTSIGSSPCVAAGFGELEGERDVDGAEGVLVELHQLGGLGRGDAVQALAGVAQHARRRARRTLASRRPAPAGSSAARARRRRGRCARGRTPRTRPRRRAGRALRAARRAARGWCPRRWWRSARASGRGARGARPTRRRRAGSRGSGRQLLVDGGGHADQHQVGGVERLDAVGEHEPVARQVAAQVALLGLQQLGLAACGSRSGAGR